MIEVQVGVDDNVDVRRVEALGSQLGEDVRWVLDPVNPHLFFGVLVPAACVDEEIVLPCLKQETVEGETNPVLLVTLGGSIPENLGDHGRTWLRRRDESTPSDIR